MSLQEIHPALVHNPLDDVSRQRVRDISLQNHMVVTWDDGHVSHYHYFWLAHNCTCEACMHPVSWERVVSLSEIDPAIRPEKVQLNGQGLLEIHWPGGSHRTCYEPGWLRRHCHVERTQSRRRKARIWNDEFRANPPRFDFSAVLENDHVLEAWLDSVLLDGMTLLTDVPCETGQVDRLGQRVSFLRETNFGRIFQVYSMKEPNSNAYTPLGLSLHTDLPNRELQPGVQMLHCIINDAEGGESFLGDGLEMAEALRREAPDYYRLLTTELVEYMFHDPKSHYETRRPVLELDEFGDVIEVHHNDWLLGALSAPPEMLGELFAANRYFTELSMRPEFHMSFRLEAGQMMAFDNRRVMHGRRAFDPRTGGRQLEGGYIDMDEMKSRLAVLRRPKPSGYQEM